MSNELNEEARMAISDRVYSIAGEIATERFRQERVHGDKNGNGDNTVLLWNTILGKRVGKVAKDVLDIRHIISPSVQFSNAELELRQRLIEVAAVAIAWVESIDYKSPQ